MLHRTKDTSIACSRVSFQDCTQSFFAEDAQAMVSMQCALQHARRHQETSFLSNVESLLKTQTSVRTDAAVSLHALVLHGAQVLHQGIRKQRLECAPSHGRTLCGDLLSATASGQLVQGQQVGAFGAIGVIKLQAVICICLTPLDLRVMGQRRTHRAFLRSWMCR